MGWLNPERATDRAVQRARAGPVQSAAAASTDGPRRGPRGPDAAPAPGGSTDPSIPPDPEAGGGSLPAEWFHRYFDVLWRLVARLGVAGHSVDDLVQETFITASRRRADIRDGQERRFLIGTAVRLCANHRQRAHVRREVCDGERLELEASAVPDAERLLIEKHLRALLDAALATLPDAHREVFVLYELEELSTSEIAEILGIPLGTVASRLARARASFSKAARSLHTEHP